MRTIVARISQYPYFPAPEYSVLIVLLLEAEVGGYRGRIYMCLSAHRVGAGRGGRGGRGGREGGLGWVGVGADNNTSLSKEEKKKVLTKN